MKAKPQLYPISHNHLIIQYCTLRYFKVKVKIYLVFTIGLLVSHITPHLMHSAKSFFQFVVSRILYKAFIYIHFESHLCIWLPLLGLKVETETNIYYMCSATHIISNPKIVHTFIIRYVNKKNENQKFEELSLETYNIYRGTEDRNLFCNQVKPLQTMAFCFI